MAACWKGGRSQAFSQCFRVRGFRNAEGCTYTVIEMNLVPSRDMRVLQIKIVYGCLGEGAGPEREERHNKWVDRGASIMCHVLYIIWRKQDHDDCRQSTCRIVR